MSQWSKEQTVLLRIGRAFLACFGSAYALAFIGIIVLYYSLPASDAAKTSWFPIILFDPFVLTVALFFATIPAAGAFIASLLFIIVRVFSNEKNPGD